MSLHRPLKIFVPHCSSLLTDNRPHGDGLVAQGFIRRLAERGHELHVAVTEVDLISPFPGNVHLYPIDTSGSRGLSKRLVYAWRVRMLFHGLMKDVAFDVIHQLNPVYTGVSLGLIGCRPPIVLGPYIAEWTNDVDAISSRHGWVRSLLKAAKRALAASQQRYAKVLLLTTSAASTRLVGRSGAQAIEILPHGVDSNLFCPEEPNAVAGWTRKTEKARTEPAKTDGVEILFMANLVRRKGVFDLLQAFDRVVARFPGTRLAIAGDGPEIGEAKSVASALSASDSVRFLGRVDRMGAVSALQRTDIYCLPSHGEPYGMAAVEAMSCGKPVVVTDAGGLGCLVDDAGGLRVPVQHPDRLAEALCALVADRDLRQSMGEHNRRRVVESMSWDRVIERLESIYVAAIRTKSAGDERAASAPMTAHSA